MTDQAWAILNLDLANGVQEVPASDRPRLLVFWWGDIPLGARAVLAAELPFNRAQVLAAAAPMLADQAEARGALAEIPRAGVDAWPRLARTVAKAQATCGFVDRLDALAGAPPPPARSLSVVVCTRDRPQALAACLDSLARQTSPPEQVVVVDNSRDRSAWAACDGRSGVTYVHEPRPGLSRARNAGVVAARGELVAFTDDDVEAPANWTQEIARAFADPAVEAVTGLVLPASLETAAQRAFEFDLGGFTSRFAPLVFDASFLEATRHMGPQVWRIGAGANMAFRRSAFARYGGFDERLGAGASGCSEDSEYWYRILAGGGVCLYEPRVVVRHHHRADWRGLRRQTRAYMQGHIAALVVQADRYGHRGNIRRIFRQLPVYFARTAVQCVQNLAWRRLGLVVEEMIGWGLGLSYLARPAWRRAGQPAAPLAPDSVQPASAAVANA